MRLSLSRLLIVIGIVSLLTAGFLIWQRYTPSRLAFNVKDQLSSAAALPAPTRLPVSLIIPAVNINLPIYPATLQDKHWDTTTQGVSYLSSSALPGQNGNSILYGHNWPNLLGPITRLQKGQDLQIIFNDNTSQSFTIEYTAIVTPDQIHILDQSSDARLTLYTCTGFLDRKRFVVTAIPTPKLST